MKIGILTLPIAENYGGTIQAIALYRFLYDQGYDVTLIYKEHNPDTLKEIIKKILLKIPFHNFKGIKTNNNDELRKKRKKFHKAFIEKEIFNISEDLYTKKNLEDFVKKENFDAVIVGSDQVWRKAYINDKYYKSYFLDFIDGNKTKKIAYAASFGKGYWEGKNDIESISTLLGDFTSVSTRELSGIQICKNTFNYKYAKHVLDPTMLMSKEFYINEIISKYDISNIHKGGIVTYVLDEANEKKELIKFIQNSRNIDIINHLKGFNTSSTIFTVPEWLNSFAYSDFIVTDSFHGMVFSIIFEKNFIVIGNKDRGLDRFISLLTLIGLEDRLFFTVNDIKDIKLNDIDYKAVNKILEENKKISLEFLSSSLNDIHK